ncbi:glycosyltransferase family 4 protein [bacterium]|nr:glycosyltransferase family 4 protein [bacterium]
MLKRKLKIATFCTNEWPTPPPENTFYAPLWIAYYIAENLAKRGHKVYYFGSKESKLKYSKLMSYGMSAVKRNNKLLPFIPRMNEAVVNFYEQLMISKIYQLAEEKKFDIIHIHPYRRAIQFAPLAKIPTVFTLHDPIEGFSRYMLEKTKKQPNTYLVSISNAQRKPSPNLNYAGTVYNGINLKNYHYNFKPKDYFLVAGRLCPEKGIDLAVQIARKTGINLKIAGGPAESSFFETKIKPYLGKKIQYLGMINYLKMEKLYRNAKAVLYPLRWEEPFGLVMAEAMACGTPVIAFDRGSVPEVVKNGKTGFVVPFYSKGKNINIRGFVKAIGKINQIKRTNCRRWVEEKFSLEKMVDNYEKIFLKLASKNLYARKVNSKNKGKNRAKT